MKELKEKILSIRRTLLGTSERAVRPVTDERWLEWKSAYRRRRNALYRVITTSRDRLVRKP